MPRRELVRLIERDARLSIENVEPTLILVPAFSYNQDHEALFRACITATRPGVRSQRHFVPYVLAYDNTSLFWSLEREKFHPNFYVDITDYLTVKLQALRLHASQVRAGRISRQPGESGTAVRLPWPGDLRGQRGRLHGAADGLLMVGVCLHQPNFIPWTKLLAKIVASDVYVVYDSVQFVRTEYHNRQRIRACRGAMSAVRSDPKCQAAASGSATSSWTTHEDWRGYHLRVLRAGVPSLQPASTRCSRSLRRCTRASHLAGRASTSI